MKLHKHFATTTLVVYWFALLSGLSIYTSTRPNDFDVMGLWMGVVIGTILGNTLAVRNVRLWLAVVIIAGISILCAPFTPPKQAGLLFWMAFIPATMCGFAALSERGALIAFWFPLVMWMLTILDHGHGALKVDGASAALLGGMACIFLAFLYARETRRVQMWRTIAPTALAPETHPVVLRDIPRLRVGIAGWSLVISSVAFAFTAWIAPRLWHVEELVPDLWTTRVAGAGIDGHGGIGLPCCHAPDEFETKRERVKEYFDIGRGHDGDTEVIDQGECVVCTPDGRPLDPRGYGYVEPPRIVTGPDCTNDPWCARGDHYGHGYSYAPGDGYGGYGGAYGTGEGYNGNGWDRGTRELTPAERRAEALRQREELRREREERRRQAEEWERDRPERERLQRLERQRQKELERQMREQRRRDELALQQERERLERLTPRHPDRQRAERERLEREEQQRLEREREARAREERARREREEREERARSAYDPKPPEIAAAPQPPPAVEPPKPPPAPQPAPPTTATADSASARAASPAGGHDLPALSWIAIVVAAGLGFQVLVLGLRPVRRLVTLRHLRKPFWNETVDQRVSNWWHLVLVGLRDAGWRTTSGEGPRDLAHRLDIPGVERAATVLERARHGVGIDTTDLAEMEDAAETAYRSSRERASTFQRFLGWFRRPLV